MNHVAHTSDDDQLMTINDVNMSCQSNSTSALPSSLLLTDAERQIQQQNVKLMREFIGYADVICGDVMSVIDNEFISLPPATSSCRLSTGARCSTTLGETTKDQTISSTSDAVRSIADCLCLFGDTPSAPCAVGNGPSRSTVHSTSTDYLRTTDYRDVRQTDNFRRQVVGRQTRKPLVCCVTPSIFDKHHTTCTAAETGSITAGSYKPSHRTVDVCHTLPVTSTGTAAASTSTAWTGDAKKSRVTFNDQHILIS